MMNTTTIKSKIAKCFAATACAALISTGSAFAAELPQGNSSSGDLAAVSYAVDSAYENAALQEKHQEIDAHVFKGGGLEKFQEMGFTVTHTGPVGGVIEIGITPYDDSYAEVLYDLFGEELVNVVEGEQAYTLIATGDGPDATVSSGEVSLMVVGGPEPGEGEAAITSLEPEVPAVQEPILLEDGDAGEELPSGDTPVSDDVVTDAELISAPAGEGAEAMPISAPVDGTAEQSASNPWPWVAAAGAALLVVAFAIRKWIVNKK